LFYSAVVRLAVSVVERELLELLPLSEQCSADEAELVRFCYENILNKVGRVCKKCFSTRLFLCIKHDTYNVLKWNIVTLDLGLHMQCNKCLSIFGSDSGFVIPCIWLVVAETFMWQLWRRKFILVIHKNSQIGERATFIYIYTCFLILLLARLHMVEGARLVMVTGVCRRRLLWSVTLCTAGLQAASPMQARRWRHATSSLIIAARRASRVTSC